MMPVRIGIIMAAYGDRLGIAVSIEILDWDTLSEGIL